MKRIVTAEELQDRVDVLEERHDKSTQTIYELENRVIDLESKVETLKAAIKIMLEPAKAD